MGPEERDAIPLGFLDQLRGRHETGGEHEAAHPLPAELGHDPRSLQGLPFQEKVDLRFPEDLDAAGMDVLQESREGEAGLLDARPVDDVVEPVRPREQREAQILGRLVGEELPHRHRGDRAAFVAAHGTAPSD